MVARSQQELERIWSNVDGVRKVSDRIVGLGPFGVGMDGLIAMSNAVPGLQLVGIAADQVYTWGAGGWLLLQAVNARATPWTITRMLAYLLVDSAVSAVPFFNSILDLFFQGHAYAARALQKDIESTHWVDASWQDVRQTGEYDMHRAQQRAERKRRLVFLRD